MESYLDFSCNLLSQLVGNNKLLQEFKQSSQRNQTECVTMNVNGELKNC